MSAAELLDLPEVRAQYSPTTVEQYHQFPEFNAQGRRTELIRGIIIEKVPKSPLHATIAGLIAQVLLAKLPSGFIIRNDQPLTLADSEPEPDVAVVAGVPRAFKSAHPSTADLVVEIAVPSVALDRKKALIYAEAGVSEYWIILAREERAEVYRDPVGGVYAETFIVEKDEGLACARLPALSLTLSEVLD